MPVSVAQTSKEKKRILIVEDEEIIAGDIKQTLEDLGYTVAGLAASGPEALELASTQTADLVLMDIRIRGEMDGIDTAEQMKRHMQLPVVYLTAHADSLTLERAKLTEPFGYLVKPFKTQDIKIAVDLALHRHSLQRHLAEGEAFSSAVLRSLGDALIVTDSRGFITLFNTPAEDLTGRTSHAVCGTHLEDALHIRYDDEDLLSVDSQVPPSSQQERTFKVGTLYRADGTERLVIISTGLLHKGAAQQDAPGTVITLRDITDLKKTEHALRENNWFLQRANDSLTQLSHSLSHDLQESLRAISMSSQLLSRHLKGSVHEREQHLQYIQDGCRRMGGLLSSLRDYYRAAATGTAATSLADSGACLKEALQNLSAAITASKALVTTSILPQVRFHPTALLQVFQNLVGNSIKYRGHDVPRIHISAARDHAGRFWIFTITDNGTGFHPDQADMIFGLFKRAHGRGHSGSGIGLALCRRLVEQHGGRIWAESAPNQGSRFHFTVPREPVTSDDFTRITSAPESEVHA